MSKILELHQNDINIITGGNAVMIGAGVGFGIGGLFSVSTAYCHKDEPEVLIFGSKLGYVKLFTVVFTALGAMMGLAVDAYAQNQIKQQEIKQQERDEFNKAMKTVKAYLDKYS